jgi:predicted nucleic acid-binding protein
VNRFVLDASLSAAWFIPDPGSDYAVQIRGSLVAEATAIVPAIWPAEMANAFAKAVRRGTFSEQAAEYGLQQLEILVISTPSRILIDSSMKGVRQAYTIARKYNLSAYDGLYLELAMDEGLPLATLDKRLRAAATRVGVRAM